MRTSFLLLTAGILAPCGDPPPEEPTCEDRAADDCLVDAGCQRATGAALAEDLTCVTERTAFCVTAPDCDGAFMLFEDPVGTRWWFGSSCAPAGWTLLTPSDAENAAQDAPDCEP